MDPTNQLLNQGNKSAPKASPPPLPTAQCSEQNYQFPSSGKFHPRVIPKRMSVADIASIDATAAQPGHVKRVAELFKKSVEEEPSEDEAVSSSGSDIPPPSPSKKKRSIFGNFWGKNGKKG